MNDLILQFNAYASEHPFVAGTLTLWFLGVGTYILKNLPVIIYNFLVKHLTTEVTMDSSCETFHRFLTWYDIKGRVSSLRTIKISNGLWGNDSSVKSLGYGQHINFIGGVPTLITLQSIKDIASSRPVDLLSIRFLGRSHNTLNNIFNEIKLTGNDELVNKFKVYIYSAQDGWIWQNPQNMQSLQNTYLPKKTMDDLVTHIDDFKSREKWNIQKGIPHQTGILLYGPPGTGKTTTIKAIASYLNTPLYILPSQSLYGIVKAFNTLPINALVCIEDIDSNLATLSRDDKKDSGHDFTLNPTNIGELLNSLDGILVSHGRILIATTNYLDRLDKALVRSGRFSLKLSIDYMTYETFKKMMCNFFPFFKIKKEFRMPKNLAASELQRLILLNLNDPAQVVENVENLKNLVYSS